MQENVKTNELPVTTIVAEPGSAGSDLLQRVMGFTPMQQSLRHPVLVTQDWVKAKEYLWAQALVAKKVRNYTFAISDNVDEISESDEVYHLQETAAQRVLDGKCEFDICNDITKVVAEPDSVGAYALQLLARLSPVQYPVLVTHDWEEKGGSLEAQVQVATEVCRCSCIIGNADVARLSYPKTDRVYLLRDERTINGLVKPQAGGFAIDPSRYSSQTDSRRQSLAHFMVAQFIKAN